MPEAKPILFIDFDCSGPASHPSTSDLRRGAAFISKLSDGTTIVQCNQLNPDGSGRCIINSERMCVYLDTSAVMQGSPRILDPKDVAGLNERVILAYLRQFPNTSRAEIAVALGTSRATVGTHIAALIKRRLVEEGEPMNASSEGGRRPIPLRLVPQENTPEQ